MIDVAMDYIGGMVQRHREFLKRERDKVKEAEAEMLRLESLYAVYMDKVKQAVLDTPHEDG